MKYTNKAFKPIIAFSLLTLFNTQSAIAQSGATINSSNPNIASVSDIDAKSPLLTIEATQNFAITLNGGSGNTVLSKSGSGVSGAIEISGSGATNLTITSDSQQALVVNASNYAKWENIVHNTSSATLTFGSGTSFVVSDGSVTDTTSEVYGLSLGGQDNSFYRFGSGGVVFEQVGNQAKNTTSSGAGVNAIGIRLDRISSLVGEITFSKIVGGQGGDGESVGGKAYGITAKTSGKILYLREGTKLVFDEIVGGDGGESSGSIVGIGGEAGGVLLDTNAPNLTIANISNPYTSYISNIGRIFFKSIQGGKSKDNTIGTIYPINNQGGGTLKIEGVSIVVGEESEEDSINYYGVRNKLENAQYNFGKTIVQGLYNPSGKATDLQGLVLDKSAKANGEFQVLGGNSDRDWQGIGLDGASVVGLTLNNATITTNSPSNNGLKIVVAGGRGGLGDNKPNGKNGDVTGVKSLENSNIMGNLAIELAKIDEGSYQYVFDQFNMIDNYGTLTFTPNSVFSVGCATDAEAQASRYRALIAINNHDTITLNSGSVIRIGSGGDQITSGIYNNFIAKTTYRLGKIDIQGNSSQTSTTGFVTKSSVQIDRIDGTFNVYGAESKPTAGFAFMGGVSTTSEITANIYGSEGNPVVGLVLGGGAELSFSNMTLNLTTQKSSNRGIGRSGNSYLAGIVLGSGSAKITSGIYTPKFLDGEGVGDNLFAIKNLSTNSGSLTLSSDTLVALGVENPSSVKHISAIYDVIGYSYEFGNGNTKTILDVGYRPNGLFFTKSIQASGNLEVQGSDERINGLTSREKEVGIISISALSVSVSGKQAYAENGADVGKSVGINVAQGGFSLQGNANGQITFNVNGGRDKTGSSSIGEAVGVLISGDSFCADEYSSFKVIGGEAYGVKLIGSAIRSHKITLNLKEANFNGSASSSGAVMGSIASYGLYNQGNTTLVGSAVFGNGSNASIGSSTSPQAYGLYNLSGTLNLLATLQFKANSILAKSDGGESGVIYNAGEIVFDKQSSIVLGDTLANMQGNLQANGTHMKIKMLEGSSMLFFDKAFSKSGDGKIDIDMGYNLTTKKGAKLSFESDAGELNALVGKYAQISLAGSNQTSINARSKEAFTPKTLSIADMQLDQSSFILFASAVDSINKSDQVVVLGSSLPQESLVNNSLHIILGDFNQESQTPTTLAQVKKDAKDRVVFNGLLQDGERVNTTTYSGFDTAVIEVERVSDSDGNAVYQSSLEIKEQSVNEDYINPTAAVLSTNFNLFSANLNSLNKRMGELRDNPFSHGVWARVFVGGQSSDFGVEATSIYTTAQMGYDYKIKLSNSSNYIGVALSYINSTTNQAVSRYRIDDLGNVILGINSAKTNGVELALYNSYIADNGFYSDSLIKVSYLLSDIDMFEQNHTYTTKNVGFSLSEEVGYRFRLGRSAEWIIDPQAELSYGYFNAEDFIQVLDGINQSYLDSRQDAISLLRSRVGVAWGYDFSHLIKKEGYKTSIYLGTYYAFDYLVGGEVSYITNNNSQASYQAMKSNGRFVLNTGLNAELDKNTRIYFDFEKSFGNVMRIDYQVNFGVRVGFGTSDKPKEENASKKELGTILKPASLQ